MTISQLQDHLLTLDELIEDLKEAEAEWTGDEDEEIVAKLETVTDAIYKAERLKMTLYEMRRQENVIYETYY
jgi:hypothetical protein